MSEPRAGDDPAIAGPDASIAAGADGSAARRASRRRDLLVGLAVVLPLGLLALLVYDATSTIAALGAGVVGALQRAGLRDPLLLGAALAGLVLALPIALVGVGTFVRHRYGQRAIGAVDRAIEAVPGLGPVYTGLRRSREVLAAPDGEAFAGVVRLQLADGVHALAFRVDRSAHETVGGEELDADDEKPDGDGGDESAKERDDDASADSHVGALGQDGLATVFLPFAPNPIVGGHLVTVTTDRIEPANLTVPQALGVLVGLGSADDAPEPEVPISSFYFDAASNSEAGSATESADEAAADGD